MPKSHAERQKVYLQKKQKQNENKEAYLAKKQNEKVWQDRKVKMRIAMPRSSIKRKRESYKKDSY